MKFLNILSGFIALLTAGTCLDATAKASDDAVTLVKVVPRETGVLLLPALDTEPWSANVLSQRQLIVRRRTQYEFISRQFKVYGETLAARAANVAPVVDLADVSARTAENMDILAKRTGANWVVGTTVEEVMEDSKGGSDRFHCYCRINLQIWNASQHRWLTNGPYRGHDEGGSSSPVWLFMESIDNATHGSLAEILRDHPPVVPVAEVGRVADYLEGQVEPFVGDPKTTFLGLGTK